MSFFKGVGENGNAKKIILKIIFLGVLKVNSLFLEPGITKLKF